MADAYRQLKHAAYKKSFQYFPSIEQMSSAQLNKFGYYKGFPCVHGHVIRHAKEHWCYQCVQKIMSNMCGFDLNYLHVDYKTKYQKLWSKIEIKSFNECWPIQNKSPYAPKRICLPSYRSERSNQKAENVTFQKAVYQCAWGDIGSQTVSRTCCSNKCANPLHLISGWNRPQTPLTISPFCIEFDAAKLMDHLNKKKPDTFCKPMGRVTISSPYDHKNIDE